MQGIRVAMQLKASKKLLTYIAYGRFKSWRGKNIPDPFLTCLAWDLTLALYSGAAMMRPTSVDYTWDGQVTLQKLFMLERFLEV